MNLTMAASVVEPLEGDVGVVKRTLRAQEPKQYSNEYIDAEIEGKITFSGNGHTPTSIVFRKII